MKCWLALKSHIQFLSLWFLAGWSPIKEEDICLYALRVEDTCGKPQERVDIAFMEQLPPHGFTRTALKEDVVRHNNRCFPIDLQEGLDMLEEVELFV